MLGGWSLLFGGWVLLAGVAATVTGALATSAVYARGCSDMFDLRIAVELVVMSSFSFLARFLAPSWSSLV